MDSGLKETVSRCIEIIQRRTPLNNQEERLLARIVNDIRVEFGLEDAGGDSCIEAGEKLQNPWFW